jgi:homeodomain-containing protein
MAGLVDQQRSGCPPRFTLAQQAEVKALACRLPAVRGLPLSRWSTADLADEAGVTGTGQFLFRSVVHHRLRLNSRLNGRHV